MKIDKRAVRLFFEKDEKVVCSIYYAYSKLLFQVSYSLLGEKEEAEEVVQETFIKALGVAPGQIRDPKAFLSYLCQMARNLSYDRLRKDSRRDPYPEGEPASMEKEDYAGGEILSKLKGILAEKEYTSLIYRLYAELSFKEIGFLMDITPSAARGYYHRALKKAKENLNKEEWL